MIDPLQAASRLASGGLQAQSTRMRVVSENISNAGSTGNVPGAEPYARKTVTFRSVMDQTLGASAVEVKGIGKDQAKFPAVYDPGNPAADAKGMVLTPNVNMMVEMADMREANRAYEGNLQVIKQVRTMTSSLIDLLRS